VRPSRSTKTRSAPSIDLLEFRRDHEDADVRDGQLAMSVWCRLAADVDAARRLVENEELGIEA